MTRFQKLTLFSAAATYLLVVIGGIVRATGSGMGCPDWPLCHGQLVPPLSDGPAWIEWTHRTVAAAIGLLALGVAALAARGRRSLPSIVIPALGALVVTALQAALGYITVRTGNAGEWVTAHLAAAMVLLALFVYLAVRARYAGRFAATGGSQRFTLVASFAALSVYAVLLFGSHVTATGAVRAFPDWPLHDGQLVPTFASDPELRALQLAQFLHRGAAALVGVIVLALGWIALRRLGNPAWGLSAARPVLVALSATAAALYAIQVVVGALQIFTRLAPWAVALHVALGAAIWALLVGTAVLAYCEARAAGQVSPSPEPPGVATGPRPPLRERIGAYVALTKPRIIELLLVTTVPAMVLAARGVPRLDLVLWTLLGGTLAAGSANAINCYLDRDIDARMTRTRRRPLPAHQVEPENALLFGLALGVLAFAQLALLVNLLSAFLALLAIAFYVVVYTLLMKRSTPHNIVIGGAAGALPPVIGWAAVTDDVTVPALLLMAIVFYWTPPHFWALSLRLTRDYRAAGVPMLPVVRGVAETTRQIGLYSVVMVALTLALFAGAQMGLLYLVGALVLGAAFLFQALRLWRSGTEAGGIRLYRASISYLTALFALIAVDVLLPVRF